jgi:threonylcarbamoyladenosine tRNA methylthiotransferase MtaB
MKIVLETLGCKLNQAETEQISWELAAAGYDVISNIIQADVFILNTCTVTNTADAKSRQRLRFIHKANPSAFIVVTGCYAERDPDTIRKIPGIGLVVTNKNKAQMILQLKEYMPLTITSDFSGLDVPASLRTRSFIKVQEGCNGACAYCIVPKVRQGETSIPIDQVLAQIQHREKLGFKEIVLTGTRVGGYSDKNTGLKELLTTILNSTKLPRIRLSSLQPQELTPSLLDLWKNNRLMPHFHMALQSGCDQTLHIMRRRYSLQSYKEALKMIRETVPDAAITTDIIIGFPGESDSMFNESYQTCEGLGFARIHVFPYSPRPTTAAASFPGVVDESTKQVRAQRMLTLATQSEEAFKIAFKGHERPVLWETQDKRGYWTGWTDNYIPIKIKGTFIANTIEPVLIE